MEMICSLGSRKGRIALLEMERDLFICIRSSNKASEFFFSIPRRRFARMPRYK